MYKYNMQQELLNTAGLEILEDSVEDLVIESTAKHPGRKVIGIHLGMCMYCIFIMSPLPHK